MKNSELFTVKSIDLFMPDGVEYIHNVLANIGWQDYTSEQAREEGLRVIAKLLELDLIEVFHFGRYHRKFREQQLSKDELMDHLRKVWFVGADFTDFTGMPMFKFKDWYLNALREAGFTDTTEWKEFVEEQIGDLEKWIADKRP